MGKEKARAKPQDGEVFMDHDSKPERKTPGILQEEQDDVAGRDFAEALIDTVREGLLVLTADLHVQTANHSFYQMFEVDKAETVGRFVYELGNGQWDIPELHTLLEDILPEQNVFNDFEVTHTFEHIGERTMLLNARQFDSIQLIVLAIEDITEQKKVSLEKEQQSRIFDTTLSNISDFAYTFDKQGHFIYSNQALLDLLGITLEDIIGKTFFDLPYPRALADRLQRQIQQVFETKQRVIDETPYTNPRGSTGFYEYIFSPVIAPDGSVEVIAGSTRDITEHKRVREALQELNNTLEQRVEERTQELERSERRFSKAFHAGPFAAIIVNRESGEILDTNESFGRLAGYRREEVIGKTTRELGLWATEEDQLKIRTAAQENGGYRELELRLKTNTGDRRRVLSSAAVIDVGSNHGLLEMFYDITERKRTEEELMEAINMVMQDTAWFSRSVLEKLAQLRSGDVDTTGVEELTKRERQVFELLAKGLNNDAIGAELHLAPQTVRNYISTVYDKINVHSRAEAVVWARERGLVGF